MAPDITSKESENLFCYSFRGYSPKSEQLNVAVYGGSPIFNERLRDYAAKRFSTNPLYLSEVKSFCIDNIVDAHHTFDLAFLFVPPSLREYINESFYGGFNRYLTQMFHSLSRSLMQGGKFCLISNYNFNMERLQAILKSGGLVYEPQVYALGSGGGLFRVAVSPPLRTRSVSELSKLAGEPPTFIGRFLERLEKVTDLELIERASVIARLHSPNVQGLPYSTQEDLAEMALMVGDCKDSASRHVIVKLIYWVFGQGIELADANQRLRESLADLRRVGSSRGNAAIAALAEELGFLVERIDGQPLTEKGEDVLRNIDVASLMATMRIEHKKIIGLLARR